MKKTLKGFITVLILALAFFPLIGSSNVSAAETTSPTEKTKKELESLKNYLDDYSVQTANENDVTDITQEEIENEVDSIKNEIDNLTPEEKEKLAYYFSNPDAMQKAIEDENNTDIVIDEEEIDSQSDFTPFARAVTKTRNASYSYSMKFFGITMTKYVVSVKYQTSGGRVKKIVTSSGYVDKNYNPVVKTSRFEKNAWIANNRAKTTSRFSYKLIHKNYGIRVGTVTIHVEGTSGGARYNAYAKLS
ncbi:hypothetical protein ACRW9N_10960 [Listeria aquatica]|uniref:hypothetical protein n=1 Tax=Listeria aquatica TaxID=1494960 RepID=UPI003EF3FCBC